MKLHVLGNNGPFPAAHGACSGYLVCAGETRIQLDLGTGTLAALTALTAPEQLDALILSHWHFDHCSDILPLIYRMEGLVAGGHAPLKVFAPVDEQSAIRRIVSASSAFTLTDIVPGESFVAGCCTVRTAAGRHPVPAMMLCVTDGVSTLCYTGDTNTTDALPAFAAGADLLLADGLFPEAAWTAGKPHLSAAHCARIAKEAGAGQLVITHLNPAIDPDTLLREARAIFPAAELSAAGKAWTL